jgi:hypothetical protein
MNKITLTDEQIMDACTKAYDNYGHRGSFKEGFEAGIEYISKLLDDIAINKKNCFRGSPLHNKDGIIELMDKLDTGQMVMVVDYIQNQLNDKNNVIESQEPFLNENELSLIRESLMTVFAINIEYMKTKKDSFSQREIPKKQTRLLKIYEKINM